LYNNVKTLPYGVADILARADDDCEDNEDAGGVEVVESVHQIVIVPDLDIRHPSHRADNTVHPVTHEQTRVRTRLSFQVWESHTNSDNFWFHAHIWEKTHSFKICALKKTQ